MALPTVEGALQVVAPVYIRKLRRRSDWGAPGDDLEERARNAVRELFRLQSEPDISIYLIRGDEDLRRVAIGMNAGRPSLREAIAFVAFLPDELRAVSIEPRPTPGNLPCEYANGLHFDMTAGDDQLEQLCRSAMQNGRIAGNCSKSIMTDVVAAAREENCRSVSAFGACLVAGCGMHTAA